MVSFTGTSTRLHGGINVFFMTTKAVYIEKIAINTGIPKPFPQHQEQINPSRTMMKKSLTVNCETATLDSQVKLEYHINSIN